MARLSLPNPFPKAERIRQRADGSWAPHPRNYSSSHIRQETNREYRLRRREEAETRQKMYDDLTTAQKIERLVGPATRQRERLVG